jgi:hypothetical protein
VAESHSVKPQYYSRRTSFLNYARRDRRRPPPTADRRRPEPHAPTPTHLPSSDSHKENQCIACGQPAGLRCALREAKEGESARAS